jgi:hypothetical protein
VEGVGVGGGGGEGLGGEEADCLGYGGLEEAAMLGVFGSVDW